MVVVVAGEGGGGGDQWRWQWLVTDDDGSCGWMVIAIAGMVVPRQGCNYITNKASRRTTDKHMETLLSHRSRRNRTHHMNDPFMHQFHFLRRRISHQQHMLHGASKPHGPQARPRLNSHSNPPLVPRPRKTRIHQSLLQTRH
ncbi:hypothetical protein HYC85_000826 [Camellia sinensis]|uniref:Uncharacterized protein n=1 Tax=Camellia sinensis TaxID=4442 RepID=A0A7J7I4R7_CAMSI|nr:hypothetical protein HYC85_000826 [Camellia sinensis]